MTFSRLCSIALSPALALVASIAAAQPPQLPPELQNAQSLFAAQKLPEAIAAYEAITKTEKNDPRPYAGLAAALYAQGEFDKALPVSLEASRLVVLPQAQRDFPGLPPGPVMLRAARISNRLGRTDEAFAWLEKAATAGLPNPQSFQSEPDLANLRTDPRWQPIAAKVSGQAGGAPSPPVAGEKPEILPEAREMELALGAAPEHLRKGAGVYVLTEQGFKLARPTTNQFTCIVNRDHPKALKPTCFDAEGTATIVPKIVRVGEMMMQGKTLAEISADIRAGFASGRFISPRRPGVAYMLSGDIRNVNPATGQVSSFPAHVMFYAPNLTNDDIGSDGSDGLPFVAYQGPHAYMIMPVATHGPGKSQ